MARQFSTIPITRREQLDVETQLRDVSEPAISAATNGTPIAVLAWHRRGDFKAAVHSLAYTGYSAGVDEWVISIEVANSTSDPYVAIASTVITDRPGLYEIPLSGQLVDQALVDETDPVIRVVATPTGTPGDLTYGAYLTAI